MRGFIFGLFYGALPYLFAIFTGCPINLHDGFCDILAVLPSLPIALLAAAILPTSSNHILFVGITVILDTIIFTLLFMLVYKIIKFFKNKQN